MIEKDSIRKLVNSQKEVQIKILESYDIPSSYLDFVKKTEQEETNNYLIVY